MADDYETKHTLTLLPFARPCITPPKGNIPNCPETIASLSKLRKHTFGINNQANFVYPHYRKAVETLSLWGEGTRKKPFYLPNSCARYGHMDPNVLNNNKVLSSDASSSSSPLTINVLVHAKSGRQDLCNDPLLNLTRLQNDLNSFELERCSGGAATTTMMEEEALVAAARCAGQPFRRFRVFDMNVRCCCLFE